MKPKPTSLLLSRRKGTRGKKPVKWPDLNFKILGAAVGCHPTYVARIMNGLLRPSMAIAERLAAVMKWDLDKVNALYQDRAKDERRKKMKRRKG